MSLVRRFCCCRSGVTAVEFSIIAGPLIFLLLSILQFSIYAFASVRLSDTVYDLSLLNKAAVNGRLQSEIAAHICPKLPAADQCLSSIQIQLAPLAHFTGLYSSIDGAQFEPGSGGAVMLLRVEAQIRSFLPGLGNLPIRASSVFVQS